MRSGAPSLSGSSALGNTVKTDALQQVTADRLRVFIGSKTGECATGREAAHAAIRGLYCDPVQLEREGARAEAQRDFYLRKLQDLHIVIGIYRKSCGWIDKARGDVHFRHQR